MGTNITQLLITHEIKMEDLSNKKLVIDAYNMIYQFLTTIRQYDGNPLTDSSGRITSHISGLFFRLCHFLKYNIKVAFVFDGEPPKLKKEERERRAELKHEALKKYEEAIEEGDIELMKKYAGRTAVLTKEIIEESKELITAFGQPIINAPSEGEAQAAYMVKKGDFYALISQDADGLLFGSPKIIKNLSITRKKKKPGKLSHETINPELIDLSENLNNLGIDIEQLIVIGILCGTDFNIGGVKGIGPKKAYDLVKKYKKNFDELFTNIKWDFSYSWKEVFNTIKNMPVSDYKLEWKSIDENKIYKLMVEKYEFSKERIEKNLQEIIKKNRQKGLSDFF